jgi:recombination protein RecA
LSPLCIIRLCLRRLLSGAWFSYGEQQLGQGREKTKQYLLAHPKLLAEIEAKVRSAMIAPASASAESSAVGKGADTEEEGDLIDAIPAAAAATETRAL